MTLFITWVPRAVSRGADQRPCLCAEPIYGVPGGIVCSASHSGSRIGFSSFASSAGLAQAGSREPHGLDMPLGLGGTGRLIGEAFDCQFRVAQRIIPGTSKYALRKVFDGPSASVNPDIGCRRLKVRYRSSVVTKRPTASGPKSRWSALRSWQQLPRSASFAKSGQSLVVVAGAFVPFSGLAKLVRRKSRYFTTVHFRGFGLREPILVYYGLFYFVRPEANRIVPPRRLRWPSRFPRQNAQ